MPDEASLLEAILADPDNDTLRLVYADWLEERGDPRGEFIRVQVQLAKLTRQAATYEPLFRRELELIREHKDTWFPSRNRLVRWECRRGFIDEVRIDATEFALVEREILPEHPVQILELRSVDPFLASVAQSPWLRWLKHLVMTTISFRQEEVAPLDFAEVERLLSQSPYLGFIPRVTYGHTHAEVLLEYRRGKRVKRKAPQQHPPRGEQSTDWSPA